MTAAPMQTTAAGTAPVATPTSRATRSPARLRMIRVRATQLTILVVLFGGWQLLVQGDPKRIILYGVPSGIIAQLRTWATQGTAVGSLGDQITTTLREALIGFAIGTVLGIVAGVALGRVRFLA